MPKRDIEKMLNDIETATTNIENVLGSSLCACNSIDESMRRIENDMRFILNSTKNGLNEVRVDDLADGLFLAASIGES